MIHSKPKKCIECGREDQPWFSKKRCKSCSQKAYSKKSESKTASKIVKNYTIKKSKRSSEYKNVYWDYFGYVEGDFIPCEVCGGVAVDIHHIDADGMGGTKNKPTIENLMALCREHHDQYGDKKIYKDLLRLIHSKRINDVS